MPHVDAAGQPKKATVMVQPPPDPEPEAVAPPPARPSQDQLAAEGLQQQTVPRRNEMRPSEAPAASSPLPVPTINTAAPSTASVTVGSAPAYQFTDADRETASKARWSTRYDWESSPVDEALSHLAEIRAEVERGGMILQKRTSEMRVERIKCFSCDNIINISEGRWAGMRTRNNWETGLPESAYACSAACMLKLNREFSHPVRIPTAREAQ